MRIEQNKKYSHFISTHANVQRSNYCVLRATKTAVAAVARWTTPKVSTQCRTAITLKSRRSDFLIAKKALLAGFWNEARNMARAEMSN